MVPALRHGVLCLLLAALSAALDLSAKVQRRTQAEQGPEPVEGEPEQEGSEISVQELPPSSSWGPPAGGSQMAEVPEKDVTQEMDKALKLMSAAVKRQRPNYVAEACDGLTRLMLSNHLLAAGLITEGVHATASRQMGKFPNEKGLQLSCFKLLVSIGSYSQQAAHEVAKEALTPVFNAISTYAVDEPWMVASTGLLQDNCYRTRKAMQAEGFTELVQLLSDTHQSEELEEAAQCFYSSVCGPKSLTDYLRDLDYLKRSMEMLKKNSHSRTTIRGQILTNIAGCFLRERADLAYMVDHGIIGELVKAVTDEHGQPGMKQLDQVGPTHLYSTALEIVAALARTNNTWRLKLIEEGVYDMMRMMMTSVHGKGGVITIAGMDTPAKKCPTALNLGHPPTTVSRTCRALSALAPSDSDFQNVGKDVLIETVSLMNTELVDYDPELLAACGGLVKLMKGSASSVAGRRSSRRAAAS